MSELVAPADDTLPAGRRASVRQRIERSPQLSAELEQQR
jgi:anti-sigma factor RsiW